MFSLVVKCGFFLQLLHQLKKEHQPSLPALVGSISVEESWPLARCSAFIYLFGLFGCRAPLPLPLTTTTPTPPPQKKVTATVSRWGAANSLSRGGDERYTRKLRRMGSASEVHYIKSRCVVQCDCSCSVTHSICSLARAARGGGPRWESSLPGG